VNDYPPFDGCEVVQRLHTGPIADTYQAVQRPLGRPVLIKALGKSILPSSPFAAILEREARILADLDHPNILHLFDFVRTEERMWMILEYLEGWSLDELSQRTGAMPPTVAVSLGLELARGLGHAHQRGIVHRAVEPKNVLVSRRGSVRITNFSMAAGDGLPQGPELYDGASGLRGHSYMSPEQILGEPADPRSDLFSLGVVLYELVSGKHPFDAPDERTAAQRIRHDHPTSLARVAPHTPSSLERLVHHCLEKMPSDRFHDAGELERALKAVLKELGASSANQALGGFLQRAGLSNEAPSPEELAPRSLLPSEQPSLRPTLIGLGICSLLLLVGSGVIHLVTSRVDSGKDAGRAARPLELMPQPSAFLRVVADPWAHVVVDGQKVETTPFARPIPLRAGTHYLRFEHPFAPTERRTVSLSPGETALLDVKMQVNAPAPLDSAEVNAPDHSSEPAVDAGPPSP
jgi:serine/threonine-protein kinase